MSSENPPNHRQQPARFGPRCDICAYFDQGKSECKKYSVPVLPYMACDSWKRNPDILIRAV